MKNKYYKKHPNSEKISNDVMKNGILLGCHQGMKIKNLNIFVKYF